MPKVLRIINRLNLGGPTFNVAYLSKYMAPDFETMIVAGTKDETEESSEFILNDLGLEPVYISDMRREISLPADRKAYLQIKKIIKQYKPDIVHTHAAKAGALGRLAAAECGVPAIVHTFHGHVFHSYFSPLKTKVFLNIERHLAKKSSAIIAISNKQKLELSEVFKIAHPDKFEVIPLGFDLTRFRDDGSKRKNFRALFKIADDEIAIGIVGRLVPVKNHELFIKSLARVLQNTDKKIRAFIIGDGEDRKKIEELAAFSGIDFTIGCPPEEVKPLTFTSWMKNIDEVNAGMDIITLTSLNEGTPVSLIEAQAAGRPIVCTRVGGIEDIVLEGVNALLSDASDEDAFTHNLLKAIEDETFRNGNAQKGMDFIHQQYHYNRLVEDMKVLYMKLMSKK